MALFVTDLDDVIIDLIGSICIYTSRYHGMSTRYEDFISFEFADIWGMSIEECDSLLDQYFRSPHFLEIKPRTDAVIGLNSLKFFGDTLAVLTSRHDLIRQHTRLWLPKAFNDVFSTTYFSSNVHTSRASGKSKTEILAEIGADFFAEDNLHYALEATEVVRFVYLFRHPWNRSYRQLPRNIIEVDNWLEVTAHRRSIDI